MNHHTIDWRKYVFSFIITCIIFATAIYISNYFSQKKIQEIHDIQDKIAIDILSSETQFSLLEESSCSDIGGTSALSQELGTLEEKLSYTEKDRGSNDPEVISLKQYYSLLEIKDYILMQKIAEKCKKTPLSIIYFYSNKGDCSDCEKEGYVLTQLRSQYPDLRIYSFDYNLDISAVKTLVSIKKVDDNLPALFADNQIMYGFKSVDMLTNSIPELKLLASSTAETATSTGR